MEGRKNDWFLVLRLTLAMLNKERLGASIPGSCFGNPTVECLGVGGVVVDCSPVWFQLDTPVGVVKVPLFALIL